MIVFGPHLPMFRGYSWFCAWGLKVTPGGNWGTMGFQGSNPCLLHAKDTLSPLSYLVDLLTFIYFFFQSCLSIASNGSIYWGE